MRIESSGTLSPSPSANAGTRWVSTRRTSFCDRQKADRPDV
jgi:hypothetical protein